MVPQKSRLLTATPTDRTAPKAPAAPDRPKRGLSRRELEVLELIADGYSTREIARALWVTEETVKTHVRRMLVRLRARTRAQAVAIAFREDLWKTRATKGERE